MLSTKHAIDIIFIALVIVAVSITAVVLARVLTDTFSGKYPGTVDQQLAQERLEEETSEFESFESPSSSTSEQAASSPTDWIAETIYGSSPFILPITWGAIAGTLIWRGKVRSNWSKQGYDYDTFRLVAKMRGSPTRIRLLNAVNSSAKNKLQLAKELDVDWKTIDNHVEMLLQSRLVEERTVVGTARYYSITQDGAKVLSLLSGSKMGSDKLDNN